MIKLKLLLEYHCYPLWIYSETDEFIDNNFPSELGGNKDINVRLDAIQTDFDNLFIDDGIEFSYKGFIDEKSRNKFYEKVKIVECLIIDALGNNGILENRITIQNL
jgi:hypothetical protein